MPAQLYHQTPGRHQTLGNVNDLRTAYMKGHLISGQSHQCCDHQVLLLRHPHCKKGGIHPIHAFNKFLSSLPWSQQSARFISKLALQKEIPLFCISPAQHNRRHVPWPKELCIIVIPGEDWEILFVLFCFALFGQFFKQKVYRDRQWWKDITTNINILLADILAPTVMKINYISFNSFTLTTY